MEVGTVVKIKNGNGEEVEAKVVARPPRMVEYVTRRNGRGRFTTKSQTAKLGTFKGYIVE